MGAGESGTGRVVLISAEPGIGKSRLAEAFRGEPRGRTAHPIALFLLAASPGQRALPVYRAARTSRRLRARRPPAVRLDKLEALLAAPHRRMRLGVAGRFIVGAGSEPLPALEFEPPAQEGTDIRSTVATARRSGAREPVLMVFEDLHWIDPTSRELLDLTLSRSHRLAVLLIATFRPEYQPPWTGQPHVTTLSLRRLGRRESDELVRGIIGNTAALPREIVAEIVERTDGVPLFVEELTKAVVESAARDAARFAAACARDSGDVARLSDGASRPARPRCQGSRPNRRGDRARVLLRAGGRDRAPERNGIAGRARSAAGCRTGLSRGIPPRALCCSSTRWCRTRLTARCCAARARQLHANIARALEEQFPGLAEAQPQILAHHFSEAGLLAQAVVYWCRAGRQSAVRSAHVEAGVQLRRGLRLVADLPDTPERKQQELELQVTSRIRWGHQRGGRIRRWQRCSVGRSGWCWKLGRRGQSATSRYCTGSG